MDNKALIVLIDLLIKDQIAKIEIPEGPQGARGPKGRDGNNFDLSQYIEEIRENIYSNFSAYQFTPEQIDILRGPKGEKGDCGDSGKNGKDGKSVEFEDVFPELENSLKQKIESIKEDLKLKFSDLLPEEIESLRGAVGPKGKDGKDFDFEESEEKIRELIDRKIDTSKEELKLKFSDLTEEEKTSIRGPRGQRGKQGKDFDFEENKENFKSLVSEKIDSVKDDLKIKFSDFLPEEIESLRGPKGDDGQNGKDFDFEDSEEKIRELIDSKIDNSKEELKLKFSDLTEEEIESLRGPKGLKGKDGKDFEFEENRELISELVNNYVSSVREQLKLKFSDLTEQETESLKLKFSDLSEDERSLLKGPRGQRGKKGDDGQDGKDGSTWTSGPGLPTEVAKEGDYHFNYATCDIYKYENNLWKKVVNIRGQRGLPGQIGLTGDKGKDGFDGLDGRDAPYVTDVEIQSDTDSFNLVFKFSDGKEIHTNSVNFPETVKNIYNSYAVSGGGGGGSGSPTEYFDEGVSLGTSSKVDFKGAGVTASMNGDTLEVNITSSGSSTEYKDEGVSLGTFPKVDFKGNGVSAVANGDTLEVNVNFSDTNTTDLVVKKDGTTVGTTDTIDFVGSNFTVTQEVDRIKVEVESSTGSADIAVADEGDVVVTSLSKINFIGDYVTVRPRINMSDWEFLSDVEPSLLDYSGDGSSTEADVYIDIPDSSILKNVDCLTDVYVGSFVYINSSEIAVNALANAYSTSNVIGLVERKDGDNKCDIRISGVSSAIFSGLDSSEDYYLSDSVAGGISSTVPVTSGHIKIKLGQSFGETKFLFSKGERVVRL